LQGETILRKNELILKEATKAVRKSVNVDTKKHISYKLRRYEIIEKNNGQLFWKSHSGLGSFKKGKKGRCHIKGGILFLEPGEIVLPSLRKREFLQVLAHMPEWKRTKYFCASYTIYYSKTGAICRRLGEDDVLKRDETKKVVINNKTFGAGMKIEPIILNKIITKDKLTTFFNLCKTLAMLILKLLLECFQLICEATRVLIGRWTRFRG